MRYLCLLGWQVFGSALHVHTYSDGRFVCGPCLGIFLFHYNVTRIRTHPVIATSLNVMILKLWAVPKFDKSSKKSDINLDFQNKRVFIPT